METALRDVINPRATSHEYDIKSAPETPICNILVAPQDVEKHPPKRPFWSTFEGNDRNFRKFKDENVMNLHPKISMLRKDVDTPMVPDFWTWSGSKMSKNQLQNDRFLAQSAFGGSTDTYCQ